MERRNEKFVQIVSRAISFAGKKVLEIGCGTGHYSAKIARKARSLVAIDPDKASIVQAEKSRVLENITFTTGSATELSFESDSFDIIIFTLSLHHIPIRRMHAAISEAYRVVRKDGHVIFLEPAMQGNFFEAEIFFDAGDGDERKQKEKARNVIYESPLLEPVAELSDTTTFVFGSVNDFRESLRPKKNIDTLPDFLEQHAKRLVAMRRIYICKPKTFN